LQSHGRGDYSLGRLCRPSARVDQLVQSLAPGRARSEEEAEPAIRLATEQRFSIWLTMGMMFRGWALVRQGQCAEGMAQLEQALADFRATEAESALPQYFALLAEGHWRAGQT